MKKDVIVYHKEKPYLLLNKTLLETQKAKANKDKIINLHTERLELIDLIREELNKEDIDKGLLFLYDALYTQIEFELQEQWNFPHNSNFHKFWDRIGCSCPVMDNNDRYPVGFYVRTVDCLLHGD